MDQGRYDPSHPPPVAEGEPDAENERLEGFRNRLRIFAARRLRDWSVAEDVAQETLGRALEAMRAGRIENPGALPGYLFKTALRICLHRIRSAEREKRALQRFGSGEAEASGNDENPLHALLWAERRASLLQGLQRLDPDERQLLEMSYRDELDSEEIGRRLGLTAGAVRVRRYRAMRCLSELLGVTRRADRSLKE